MFIKDTYYGPDLKYQKIGLREKVELWFLMAMTFFSVDTFYARLARYICALCRNCIIDASLLHAAGRLQTTCYSLLQELGLILQSDILEVGVHFLQIRLR
jgi:hypothetical protein